MSNLYQHYKGGLYKLITYATLEATGLNMVVYQCLKSKHSYVRPEVEFVQKFTYLKPEKSIDSHLLKQNINEFL